MSTSGIATLYPRIANSALTANCPALPMCCVLLGTYFITSTTRRPTWAGAKGIRALLRRGGAASTINRTDQNNPATDMLGAAHALHTSHFKRLKIQNDCAHPSSAQRRNGGSGDPWCRCFPGCPPKDQLRPSLALAVRATLEFVFPIQASTSFQRCSASRSRSNM